MLSGRTARLGVSGVVVAALGLLLFAVPTANGGQSPSPDPNPTRPFERGALGIELGIGPYAEAWNLNDNGREWLADGTFSIWWSFASRTTLVVEFHATRVFQETLRDGWVTGLIPVVRVQVLDRSPWDVFAEIGVGPSWSDTAVPAGGTRFNYFGLAGAGVSRSIGPRVNVTAGFRWLHLSNNGREGHDHNPDIQALGGFVGTTVAF